MNEITRRRRALCLRLAEAIIEHRRTNIFDADDLADLIEMELPQTYQEQEADIEETMEASPAPDPNNPGLLTQLRLALGFGPEISLEQTMRAAIERINAARSR